MQSIVIFVYAVSIVNGIRLSQLNGLVDTSNQSIISEVEPEKTTWIYYSTGGAFCTEFSTFFPMTPENYRTFQYDFVPDCLGKHGFESFLAAKFEKKDVFFSDLGIDSPAIQSSIDGPLGCQKMGYLSEEFYSKEWNCHLTHGNKMDVYGLEDAEGPELLSPQGGKYSYYMYLWILDQCFTYNFHLVKTIVDDEKKNLWRKCFSGWDDGYNAEKKDPGYEKDPSVGACGWAAWKCKEDDACTKKAKELVPGDWFTFADSFKGIKTKDGLVKINGKWVCK